MIGRMRDRLRFEKRATAADDYGNVQGDWESQCTRAVEIQPIRGGEQITAARLEGRQPAQITVRRDSATALIAADWRAVDTRSGAVYAITAPPTDMDRRGAYLTILATTGAEP